RLRRRLPEREQRSRDRQGTGRLWSQAAMAAFGALAGWVGHQAAQLVRADVLSALRRCAVRAGVPGLRGLPYSGGPERAGVQPMRGHTLLRERVHLSRPLLQLVQLRVAGAARSPTQP